MRISARWLANPTTVGTTQGLKPAPLALLPPIPLYRRLLRTHRKFLPNEMRVLGDEYVKSEFRSHRNVENPMHIVRTLSLACKATAAELASTDRILDRMADVRAEDRG